MEVPPPVVIDDQGPGLLLEYWHMLRRRKGTLLLIAFLGLLASVLLTLPQTPVYQARTTLEIQNLNENFLNMRNVSPTANEGAARPARNRPPDAGQYSPERIRPRAGHRQARLRTKLLAEKDKGRLSAWRKALGLPESKPSLDDRRYPAPGGREPEGSHASQHAASRNPLRFHRPAFWPPTSSTP